MWPPAGKTIRELVHGEALEIYHHYKSSPLPDGAIERLEDIFIEADQALIENG
jgi:hypothetical protein